MLWGESARRKLKFLLTGEAPKIHEWGELLAAALDNDVEAKKGKLSERPATGVGVGLFGRLFYVEGDATAENNGIWWFDTGTTWLALNQPAVAQVYGGQTSRTLGTEYEPSSTRATYVMLSIKSLFSSVNTFSVFCGGVEIALGKLPKSASLEEYELPVGFICPAGKKWKVTGANIQTITSSYLPL